MHTTAGITKAGITENSPYTHAAQIGNAIVEAITANSIPITRISESSINFPPRMFPALL